MPGVVSKQSRELANVRLQLKSGKNRGTNPRRLTPEDVRALEARREQLASTVGARRLLRVVGRVNAHTTQVFDIDFVNKKDCDGISPYT